MALAPPPQLSQAGGSRLLPCPPLSVLLLRGAFLAQAPRDRPASVSPPDPAHRQERWRSRHARLRGCPSRGPPAARLGGPTCDRGMATPACPPAPEWPADPTDHPRLGPPESAPCRLAPPPGGWACDAASPAPPGLRSPREGEAPPTRPAAAAPTRELRRGATVWLFWELHCLASQESPSFPRGH